MLSVRLCYVSILIVLALTWHVVLGQQSRPDSVAVTISTSGDSTSAVLQSDNPGSADSTAAIPSSLIADSVTLFRRIENQAFQVGEHLVFDVAYGIINAGKATMSIPDTQTVSGRPCYHILTTAASNKFFSTFHKVRDRAETFIDIDGIFPWRFEKHIREGRYKADRSATFDQRNNLAIYRNDTTIVVPYVQGVLSSFYYIRTVPLEVGAAFDIDNFGDGKLYPLRILVHKRERVKVPAGTFDCIVVEPVLRSEGIFKSTGKITIWLTDDERRIPVLMKTKVLIGSIDAKLKSYRLK